MPPRYRVYTALRAFYIQKLYRTVSTIMIFIHKIILNTAGQQGNTPGKERVIRRLSGAVCRMYQDTLSVKDR
ncbi:hypothetical protein OO18_09650 [Raoultella ornithinolytica]|nr:hypothetical protein HY59_07355 [Raoultella ornithinolytica]AOO56791.1 hypothetical protein AN237_09850 [Raoultella ornithinolytica]KIZ44623.1 hypothetical protein OO18_09650 [Raoultella ornithinolytica]